MNNEQIEQLKRTTEEAKNVALADLEDKFIREIQALKNASAVSIKLPPLMAFAIITQIQLASRHPANVGWCREQACSAARQLEDLFDPDSAIALALEMGWDETKDRPIKPEGKIVAETASLGDVSEAELLAIARLEQVSRQIVDDLNEIEPDAGWEIL